MKEGEVYEDHEDLVAVEKEYEKVGVDFGDGWLQCYVQFTKN